METARRLAVATLLVASGDIAWAMLWVALTRGAGPKRVLQSVASGLLGPAAFTGGWGTAMLGLALHVCIALGWTSLFALVQQRSSGLRTVVTRPRGALVVGLVYGAVVWLLMDGVVLPLSRARASSPASLWFWLQLLMHPIVVGLPIVLVLARPEPSRPRAAEG